MGGIRTWQRHLPRSIPSVWTVHPAGTSRSPASAQAAARAPRPLHVPPERSSQGWAGPAPGRPPAASLGLRAPRVGRERQGPPEGDPQGSPGPGQPRPRAPPGPPPDLTAPARLQSPAGRARDGLRRAEEKRHRTLPRRRPQPLERPRRSGAARCLPRLPHSPRPAGGRRKRCRASGTGAPGGRSRAGSAASAPRPPGARGRLRACARAPAPRSHLAPRCARRPRGRARGAHPGTRGWLCALPAALRGSLLPPEGHPVRGGIDQALPVLGNNTKSL